MSRSCHSGTFSKPATALPRSTRARPLMRSQVIGLRLCGIAEEPFCPRANGSAASRTSLRCRWRTSVAKRSRELPRIASDASSSACRSRATTWVATSSRAQAELGQREILDARVDVAVRADGARELAHGDAGEGALDALAARRSSYHQPSSLSPNVVGSACTPWVRPMQGVARCSSARSSTAASARSQPASTSAPAARSCSARPVSTTSEDVRP